MATWLWIATACSPAPLATRPAPYAPSALERECAQGSPEACAQLGAALVRDPATVRRGRALLERACDQGARVGCLALGETFLDENDVDRGEVLLELACAAWEARACLLLGRRYRGERASRYLEHACLGDELEGCVALGDAWATDVPLAMSLFDWACQHTHDSGCVGLARLVLHGARRANTNVLREACQRTGAACTALAALSIARDTTPDVVANHLARGCALGEPLACAAHGLMLYYGWGVTKAPATALAELGAACELGFERACTGFSVSELLETGCAEPTECAAAVEAWEGQGEREWPALLTVVNRGLVRTCGEACLRVAEDGAADNPRARSWYARACERERESCARVDLERALGLAEVRCNDGSLAHCVLLANQLHDPDADAEDDALLSILARACDLGHGDSCARLGLWFAGAGSNREQAINLLRRACELDAAAGCAGLEELGASP